MKRLLLILAVLMIACFMTACGKSGLVGSWTGNFENMSTTFTFNEDGSGKIETLGILDLDITYTAKDSRISITVGTLEAQEVHEMQYKVDGDSLILQDTDGVSYSFERVK